MAVDGDLVGTGVGSSDNVSGHFGLKRGEEVRWEVGVGGEVR